MDIRPDYANIIVDGKLEQVDPDDVEIGTEIVVNPGEKVPIDGVITEGNTTLNTSALTGESVPRNAKCGEEVISGCINLTGTITLKTTKEFGDSTVSKILDLVENSSMKSQDRRTLLQNLPNIIRRQFVTVHWHWQFCRHSFPVDRNFTGMAAMDRACTYVPRNQLPMCSCDFHSA